MSILTIAYVCCDVCNPEANTHKGRGVYLGGLKDAAYIGWERRKRVDMCPDCLDDADAKKPPGKVMPPVRKAEPELSWERQP